MNYGVPTVHRERVQTVGNRRKSAGPNALKPFETLCGNAQYIVYNSPYGFTNVRSRQVHG